MKTITKVALVLILSAMTFNAGAQIDIVTETGTNLPTSIYIGEDFSVMVVEDDIPVDAGATVVFTSQYGDTACRITNDNGIVSYTPYSTGTLRIKITNGITTVVEKMTMVINEPWVPDSEPDQIPTIIDTPEPVPTPEPTPVPTPVPTPDVLVTPGVVTVIPPITIPDTANNTTSSIVPRQTTEPITPTSVTTPVPPVIETTEEAEQKTLPRAPESPGFGGIVAIGILGIVYFLRR